MATGPRYFVPFRRRREGKTDYYARGRLIVADSPRMVVRVTNKHVIIQLVTAEMDGDKTLVSATSKELKALGYSGNTKNTPAIYLTSLLLCQKAKKKNVKEVILDLGARNYKSGNKIFAGLKAIVDSGIICPFDEKAFPSKDRIEGKVTAEYLKKPIDKEFISTKEKILKM